MHSTAAVLREKGYDAYYFYGGNSYFDNMETFFGGNGYRIIDLKKATKTRRDHLRQHLGAFATKTPTTK